MSVNPARQAAVFFGRGAGTRGFTGVPQYSSNTRPLACFITDSPTSFRLVLTFSIVVTDARSRIATAKAISFIAAVAYSSHGWGSGASKCQGTGSGANRQGSGWGPSPFGGGGGGTRKCHGGQMSSPSSQPAGSILPA